MVERKPEELSVVGSIPTSGTSLCFITLASAIGMLGKNQLLLFFLCNAFCECYFLLKSKELYEVKRRVAMTKKSLFFLMFFVNTLSAMHVGISGKRSLPTITRVVKEDELLNVETLKKDPGMIIAALKIKSKKEEKVQKKVCSEPVVIKNKTEQNGCIVKKTESDLQKK